MAISRQGLCATQLAGDYADPAVLPINPVVPADTGVSYSLSADLMTAAQLLRQAAQEGAASAGGSDGNTDSSEKIALNMAMMIKDLGLRGGSYDDEDGDFIYYTSGRASDTHYKVDFLTVRTPKTGPIRRFRTGKLCFWTMRIRTPAIRAILREWFRLGRYCSNRYDSDGRGDRAALRSACSSTRTTRLR